MSEESIKVVLAQFEAINRGDLAAAEALQSEDSVLVVDPSVGPDSGTFRGAEVPRWYGRWFRTFGDDYRFELEDVIEVGEAVVVMARHHGTGRSSGVPVEMLTAPVFWVRDGKIERAELYREKADGLRAAKARS